MEILKFVIVAFTILAPIRVIFAAVTKPTYPTVKKDAAAVDDYFGIKIPNPFKWLTKADKKAKTAFMNDQTSTTKKYVAQVPAADRKSIEKYIGMYEHESVLKFLPPVKAGDYFFFHDEFENKVFVQKGLKGKATVLLSEKSDTLKIPGGRIIIEVPTSNGETVAYAFSSCFTIVCYSTVKFKTTATGKDLADTLLNVESIQHSSDALAWNTDGSGLYYLTNSATPASPPKTKGKGKKTFLFHHTMGTKQSDDILIAEFPHISISQLKYSDDGQYLALVYDHHVLFELNPKMAEKMKNDESVYVLELCAKGKAPCKPTKDNKPKVTKIPIGEDLLHFLGNIGTQLYFFFECAEDHWNNKVVHFELANHKRKDWKTVDVTPKGSELEVLHVQMINSEYLFLDAANMEHEETQILYNIKTKTTKELPAQHGHFFGLSAFRKDPNVIFEISTMVSKAEAFVLDTTKTPLKLEKLQLPGAATDPFRDTLVYEDKNYTSHGTQFPMLLAYPKNFKKDGKAPMLLVLQSSATATMTPCSLKTMFTPFMELFGGIVGLVSVEIPELQLSPLPPTQTSVESAAAAIELLVKEKYADKNRLVVVPEFSEFNALIGALINQRPDLVGAALLIDPHLPSAHILDYDSKTLKWMLEHSSKTLDLNPFYKDKATTKEFSAMSAVSNIKAPKDTSVQYPAVFILDLGTEDAMRYIAQLQTELGKQAKPFLAKFPVGAVTATKSMEDAQTEQIADIFSFLALSLDYKIVTK